MTFLLPFYHLKMWQGTFMSPSLIAALSSVTTNPHKQDKIDQCSNETNDLVLIN